MGTINETEELWSLVRRSIVGWNAFVDTPFGSRRLTYADYTASGRAVGFLEDYLRRVLELYGNTHTEDDATGIATSQRLLQAEKTIKRFVNAGKDYRLIAVGSGTTAAVHLLQQILGVYIPPAAKDMLGKLVKDRLPEQEFEGLSRHLREARPVVLVGPYEHHSNEVSWRECFAEVAEVNLTADGLLDLEDLERKASSEKYRGRRMIGAFSAASNVSGVKTPVYEVARILHRHGALAFFDFAALAPYERIDVNRDAQSYFDAIYFSPHKLMGGPGACGILVIHRKIYRVDLPPTVGAGGTVDFVNFDDQEYSPDIEVREKPGTPGIMQTLRAALAVELKEALDPQMIERREKEITAEASLRLHGHPAIELMGDVEPQHRLPIFSFNIRVGTSYLHPRFIATLLNDLFGIQSRAGCSCAAPYGHRILHIDEEKSRALRRTIMRGNAGLKPGWARVNFHFLHTGEEFDFICRAVLFIAEWGSSFLPLYSFDIHTGKWRHKDYHPAPVSFGLEEALRPGGGNAGGGESDAAPLGKLFDRYLREAEELARTLKEKYADQELKTTEKTLIPFVYM
jgi:selenocysteine lyase/cysteine desulfurase